jgi:hypothetical protein
LLGSAFLHSPPFAVHEMFTVVAENGMMIATTPRFKSLVCKHFGRRR